MIEIEGLYGTDSVETLAALVNEVYAASENGLWSKGAARTSPSELAALAGQIAVAWLDGRPAGCVRVRRVDESVSEFGLLAAAPAYQGLGVGRALVAYAERRALSEGSRVMRLELIVPREWTHPSKAFLAGWYGRLGYRPVRRSTLEDAHPELVASQATPCEVVVYEKPLR
jgi:GNAT superfamily N-acetyltransferase